MKKITQNKLSDALDVINIQKRVAKSIKQPLKNLEDIRSFLARWWCRYYKKPYKCTEIQEYTVEELLYEYFDIYYSTNPEELDKFLNDDLDDETVKEDEDWVKEQMGDDYISIKDQEKALKDSEKDIRKATKKDKTDDMYIDFEDFK